MEKQLDRLEEIVDNLEKHAKDAAKIIGTAVESNQRSLVAYEETMFMSKELKNKYKEIEEKDMELEKMIENVYELVEEDIPWYHRFSLVAWGIVLFVIIIILTAL